jgi:hypothetical protein
MQPSSSSICLPEGASVLFMILISARHVCGIRLAAQFKSLAHTSEIKPALHRELLPSQQRGSPVKTTGINIRFPLHKARIEKKTNIPKNTGKLLGFVELCQLSALKRTAQQTID